MTLKRRRILSSRNWRHEAGKPPVCYPPEATPLDVDFTGLLLSFGSWPKWKSSIERTTEDQYFQVCPPGALLHSAEIPIASSP